MKQYVEEQIIEVSAEIKKYEAKTYQIQEMSTMVNDKREYDRLVGEQRTLERMVVLIAREAKDNEKKSLEAKIKAQEAKGIVQDITKV